MIKTEEHTRQVQRAMEILLCMSLSYYYIAHAFMFWQDSIFGFKIVYLAQLIFLIIPFGLLLFWEYRNEISLFEYVFVMAIVLYSYLSSRYHFDTEWYRDEFHWAIMGIGTGVFISRKRLPVWVFWIPLLIVLSTISYNYFVLSQTTPAKIFSMNRNRYSMIITSLGFLGLMNYTLRKKLGTWPALAMALLTLILSYYSQSRGVLLVSSAMAIFVYTVFCYTLFQKVNKSSQAHKVFKFFVYTLLSSVFLGIIGLVVLFIRHSRLATTGFEDKARIMLLKGFFNELTFKNFFTGFDIELVAPRFSHVHNSFLQLIVDGGALSLFFYYQLIMTAWYYFKQRSPLLVFLGFLFFYALVDHIFYTRYTDLILFPLIINAFYVHRTQKKKQEL